MSTFVKIEVGQEVYDSNSKLTGKVKEINSGVAIISTEEGMLTTNLISLTPISITVKGKLSDNTEGFNKLTAQTKEFHTVFNHPVGEKPTPLTLDRVVDRSNWTIEEVVESVHASSSNDEEFNAAVDELVTGINKARKKSLKDSYPESDLDRLVAQSDALVDSAYFISGSFTEMGVQPDQLFEIVQQANLSKLFKDENGNKYPKYRESDGKILKSPEFFEPEPKLKEEIENQIRNSQ